MTDPERDKWNARYMIPGYAMGEDPKPWLEAISDHLKGAGRALELACGEGQNAVYLAQRGYEVTGVDIAEMGLRKAQILAMEYGVKIAVVEADLDEDTSALTPSTFALVTCFHYLNRALAPRIAAALVPGGLVAVEILGEANLERHPRPGARYLVGPGELEGWFVPLGLEVVESFEGWDGDRYVCRLLARRPVQ